MTQITQIPIGPATPEARMFHVKRIGPSFPRGALLDQSRRTCRYLFNLCHLWII